MLFIVRIWDVVETEDKISLICTLCHKHYRDIATPRFILHKTHDTHSIINKREFLESCGQSPGHFKLSTEFDNLKSHHLGVYSIDQPIRVMNKHRGEYESALKFDPQANENAQAFHYLNSLPSDLPTV